MGAKVPDSPDDARHTRRRRPPHGPGIPSRRSFHSPAAAPLRDPGGGEIWRKFGANLELSGRSRRVPFWTLFKFIRFVDISTTGREDTDGSSSGGPRVPDFGGNGSVQHRLDA